MKEIDETVYNLITKRGFIEEFWARFRTANVSGRPRTQESIFEELNDIYEDEFGEPRFPSFDSFRKSRDRAVRRKLQ